MPVSGQSSRENRRRRVEEARRAEARRKRRVRLGLAAGAIVVVAGAGAGVGVAVSGGGGDGGGGLVGNAADYLPLSTLGTLTAAPAAGALGPENVPIPNAPVQSGDVGTTAGQAIDRMGYRASEQTIFHIHTPLTISVNGRRHKSPRRSASRRRAQQTSAGPFIGSGTCSTGCTRTRPTASSTSSRQSSAPTRSASSSTIGRSPSAPASWARPRARSPSSSTESFKGTRATSRSAPTRTSSSTWAPR